MEIADLRAGVLRAQEPLAPHTVHVWRTALSAITCVADEMKTLLSADEQIRAERFRFPEHRHAFIVARALLRMILGAYCRCAPEDLRFTYGNQGKPGIDEAASRLSRTVSFNLSHSTKSLQIAVAAEAALGIDIEDCSRDFDVDGLMAECLTQEEARPLNSLSAEQRRNAFLRHWVHKEAFLKCAGTGFSVSPKEVHVSFGDGGRSEMRCSNPMADAVLLGRDLETDPGHLAAIATTDRDYELQFIVF
ncbi:MAG TPA: 4'-phosphopantetheinyl transferase superfamily protein [Acidobacteriaceae bacterium]|jgi:4'-phosphopantetheinyl transferase|nr:4'-phosphopantetheinyl transferase superfamily protein [Acidobacteriaceae bacterium]